MGSQGVTTGKTHDWTLVVLSAVLSAVITSVGWYVGLRTQLDDKVTRPETVELIRSQAPYLEDRKHLIATLQTLQTTARANQQAITDLRVEVGRLNGVITELQRTLEAR